VDLKETTLAVSWTPLFWILAEFFPALTFSLAAGTGNSVQDQPQIRAVFPCWTGNAVVTQILAFYQMEIGHKLTPIAFQVNSDFYVGLVSVGFEGGLNLDIGILSPPSSQPENLAILYCA